LSSNCKRDKFELIDSIEHSLNKHKVAISYMKLYIEPDFQLKKIECKQMLELICVDDLNDRKLELDCADLNITKIEYNEIVYPENITELGFLCSNEKLIIQLPKDLSEGTKFLLKIEYFAFPKRGFHFINSNDNDHVSDQAWTQGQMIESRYWFPCIDEPQIKFRWEISVCVPNDFVVISNGKDMDIKDNNNNSKKIFRWVEDSPNSTYLTCIAIGKFFVSKKTYDKNENESSDKEKIKLLYCVPTDKKDRIERTFGETPQMMMFFESFFGVSYPYSKYAQTTVKDFEHGGMENTSCTILQEGILLDERVAKNEDNYYFNSLSSNRSIIAHELVHQWFGDLVTCLDWEDIWLNEGFATYGEALYIENTNKNNKNEFLRYMTLLQAEYTDEACNDYERSVVTSRYKYPDELFDSHSYKKGGWILHMLRNQIGETNFKMSLKKYLEKYQYKNTKTSDFMKVLEEVSDEDLESFFRQWINNPGHPELDIAFDDKTNSIKIIQIQDKLFNFKLEIEISPSNVDAPKIYSFNIKERENTIHISKFDQNKNEEKKPWFSIDPELKILKEIKSYEVPISMIINQIKNGETIIGRRQGITAIDEKSITKENYNEIIELLKNTILNDEFYWVSALAASKLGQFGSYKKIDKEIKNKAFDSIRECLNEIKNESKIGKNVVIYNLILALGNYISNISDYDPKNSLFDELKDIAKNDNDSYYIQGAALSTIGNDAMDKENTFNDYIPRHALGGLAKFYEVKETKMRNDVIKSLIRKTNSKNSNSVRNTATVRLTEFLFEPEIEPDNKKIVNYDVFTTLMRCLDDPWLHIRKAACGIFETKFNQDDMEIKDKDQLLNKLEQMTNTDLSYDVRRNAQLCLFAIRDRTYSKKRKTMNEKEFNEYVSAKLKIRTKNVFGPKII
jgi:aminopeptidase N